MLAKVEAKVTPIPPENVPPTPVNEPSESIEPFEYIIAFVVPLPTVSLAGVATTFPTFNFELTFA